MDDLDRTALKMAARELNNLLGLRPAIKLTADDLVGPLQTAAKLVHPNDDLTPATREVLARVTNGASAVAFAPPVAEPTPTPTPTTPTPTPALEPVQPPATGKHKYGGPMIDKIVTLVTVNGPISIEALEKELRSHFPDKTQAAIHHTLIAQIPRFNKQGFDVQIERTEQGFVVKERPAP
jgi:hypothetical protein